MNYGMSEESDADKVEGSLLIVKGSLLRKSMAKTRKTLPPRSVRKGNDADFQCCGKRLITTK
eukprot:4721404-Pleurochrysis_carterae.AAC.2